MAAPRAGRKPSTSSSDERLARLQQAVASLTKTVASIQETLARQEKDLDEVFFQCRARFQYYEKAIRVHEGWFAELLEPRVPLNEAMRDPTFDLLKDMRDRVKKGTRQATEKARKLSEKSAEARDMEERDMYIASCANPLLASGDYANDDEVIAVILDPIKTPWSEKFGDRPGYDRMKVIFARLRKANQMEAARHGRRKLSS
jgi:hypothetical protein